MDPSNLGSRWGEGDLIKQSKQKYGVRECVFVFCCLSENQRNDGCSKASCLTLDPTLSQWSPLLCWNLPPHAASFHFFLSINFIVHVVRASVGTVVGGQGPIFFTLTSQGLRSIAREIQGVSRALSHASEDGSMMWANRSFLIWLFPLPVFSVSGTMRCSAGGTVFLTSFVSLALSSFPVQCCFIWKQIKQST